MDIINTEQFIKYGQWVIVVISLLGVYLLSSTKPKSRLSGYIVTALCRFSCAIMYIVLVLYCIITHDALLSVVCSDYCIIMILIFSLIS